VTPHLYTFKEPKLHPFFLGGDHIRFSIYDTCKITKDGKLLRTAKEQGMELETVKTRLNWKLKYCTMKSAVRRESKITIE